MRKLILTKKTSTANAQIAVRLHQTVWLLKGAAIRESNVKRADGRRVI